MNVINDLIRELISKKNNVKAKSFEHERTFKKCSYILDTFHPLEVNPNQVNNELVNLCYKLEVHSLNHKADHLRLFSERIIQLCADNLERDRYLLSHSILLFLIEIHQSLVHDNHDDDTRLYETIDNNNNNKEIYEVIDWGSVLQSSADIKSMTREYYGSDTSSDTCSAIEDTEGGGCVVTETLAVENKSISVNYDLIGDLGYEVGDLESVCSSSIQSEYWLSNSGGGDGGRVEMTEYQFVREVLEVLQGARLCSVWRLQVDSQSINCNRYTVSKHCKVSHLSPGALDSVSQPLCLLASSCLRLRTVCAFLTAGQQQQPPLTALAEQLHLLALQGLSEEALRLETLSRNSGPGLSLLELVASPLITLWAPRLSLLTDILLCVTSGRLEALRYPSTTVSLLDLLYHLTKDSCLLDTIDPWTVSTLLRLFHHALRPYLASLSCLLSQPLLHATTQHSSCLFLDIATLDSSDIALYFQSHFTINKTATQSLLSTLPLLLHPVTIQLISTIKSIDLLRLLSVELNQPAILSTIMKEQSNFNHYLNFNNNNVIDNLINNNTDVVYPSLSEYMFKELLGSLSSSTSTGATVGALVVTETEACRRLPRLLLEDVALRHQTVNRHLLHTYIETLHLRTALSTIKHVHFLQAGLEMYHFSFSLFSSLIANNNNYNSNNNSSNQLTLQLNLKLQHVLSESPNEQLRTEASRLLLKLSGPSSHSQHRVVVSGFNHRLIDVLSRLSIDYSVPWSLRLVVTEQLLSTANSCLSFLLRLRLAKHCLERQSPPAATAAPSPSLQRRRCALRLKLLQVVNSFFNYILNTFIVPSWLSIDSALSATHCGTVDIADFIEKEINGPFRTMARGCLQIDELAKFRKAIDLVILLAVNVSLGGDHAGTVLFEHLETEYRRLVDFISAMFKGLGNMGITINGLDMAAFK